MSEIHINTTQNVNLSFTAASVGERILAYGVDLIIKGAYATIVIWLFRDLIFQMFSDKWSEIAAFLILLFPYMVYTLVLETFFEGQTVGKKLLKIRVVKIDEYQASFADYLIRWLFRVVDINMMGGVVALISIVVNKKSQRLGDVTAGTSVISLQDKTSITHTILEELASTYKPTYPSVIKLSDNDVRIIKETLLTAKKSRDYKTLIKLRNKVEEVIETKSQHETDVFFIDTIIKDYNYYTQSM